MSRQVRERGHRQLYESHSPDTAVIVAHIIQVFAYYYYCLMCRKVKHIKQSFNRSTRDGVDNLILTNRYT